MGAHGEDAKPLGDTLPSNRGGSGGRAVGVRCIPGRLPLRYRYGAG